MNDTMRVAAVQFDLRPVKRDSDFFARCAYFAAAAAGHGVDVLLFPELVTTPLLPHLTGATVAERVERATPALLEGFRSLAMSNRLDLIVGSHLSVVEGQLRNVAYLVRRDGAIATQSKLHITPSEKEAWQ